MNGVAGIWGSLLTVIATLRSSFAKHVALGVSLGENLTKSLSRYVRPWIIRHADEEFKQWIDFSFLTLCKIIGVGLAIMLARMVSAFHSAIKGGNLIGHVLFRFLGNRQLIPPEMQEAIIRASSTASSAAATTNAASSSSLSPNATDSHHSNRSRTSDTVSNDIGREIVEQNTLFIFTQYALALYGFYWQLSQGFQINFWLVRLILFPLILAEGIFTWLAAY
ncbi:hypothetical protein RFI_37516 [Reticulomyxa filosa]|uniref:ABC transmembrane type-1 domain-containing protein n=1 Tax=Reticulomyxa filosa TaxID=46433 RepID=X6LFQ6_RETFI|nr:hypothetical protein RFI_37516 [Reticulomyxa filosa]|eukprot:ETN99951.1 hypothetical protein RFI_37516 [Reticulomyxa filosa]